MMMAMLHSNGQLRTERDGDTEKGCQKSPVSRRLLINYAVGSEGTMYAQSPESGTWVQYSRIKIVVSPVCSTNL